MKIAVWHNLKGGGAKRALYEQVKGLVARGHAVETFCPQTADLGYLPLTEFGPRHLVPLTTGRVPRAGVAAGLRRTLDALAAMDVHCRNCAQRINDGRFDVLLAYPCFQFAVTPLGRYVTGPRLLYLHEPCRRLYEALPVLPWVAPANTSGPWWSPRTLKRTLENVVTTQGLRIQAREALAGVEAYDRVLVNSRFSRESILRAYGIEARVCYLGVDVDRFHPLDLPRERSVIGMGGLFPVKRPDRAIHALATIDADRRPALVWVGHFCDPGYRAEMELLAQRLEVSFTVLIGLSDQDVIEQLNRTSAMLYTPQLEPFGLAPLEASACGTPVVAIAEGGIRETVVEGVNGFLADGDDPEVLGRLVVKLLDEPGLQARLGRTAREHVVKSWPWEKAVDSLEEHLMAVAAKGERRR